MVKSCGWLGVLFVLSTGGYSYVEERYEPSVLVSDCRLEEGYFAEEKLLQGSLEEVLREIETVINGTSQIQILDLQYDYPKLVINLSKELIAYGGGNEAEYQVVARLLEWGFENTMAGSVEIYVEGKGDLFPEGSMSIPCSRDSYEKYYSEYE